MNETFNWLTSESSFELPMPDFHIKGPLFVIVLAVIAFFASQGWIARDAERRGKNPFAAVFFCLAAGWPVSLLWWRWLRPPLLTEKAVKAGN